MWSSHGVSLRGASWALSSHLSSLGGVTLSFSGTINSDGERAAGSIS